MATIDDPRIRCGMDALLSARKALLESGETSLGWKVAFSTPAAMMKLGIHEPLVGFLMTSNLVPSGGAASVAGWNKPAAEPEIAVHMHNDLGADVDDATVAAAIGGLSPAIELADVSFPPEDVERVLKGNIYHRHVVIGRSEQRRAGAVACDLIGRIQRRGIETARVSDPESVTGKLIQIVRSVANVLASFGETLRANEIVITGSITPPIFLEADEDALGFELDPIGGVSVRILR